MSGAEEATRYPAQPESSPFAADPTGVEPPLGYAIDEQAPVGEAGEIAASLAQSVGGEDAARGLADAPLASGVEHSEASSLLDLMEAKMEAKR